MRKILFLIILIIVAFSPVLASDWYELYSKAYIDRESISWKGNVISFWTKTLNPGSWKLIDNKKIWYLLSYNKISCRERKYSIQTLVAYDLKGNVVSTIDIPDALLEWQNIVPDTRDDVLYDVFCTEK